LTSPFFLAYALFLLRRNYIHRASEGNGKFGAAAFCAMMDVMVVALDAQALCDKTTIAGLFKFSDFCITFYKKVIRKIN